MLSFSSIFFHMRMQKMLKHANRLRWQRKCESQCAHNIMCFLCSCLTETKNNAKTRGYTLNRLKCLRGGKHPFYGSIFSFIVNKIQAKHSTSVVVCAYKHGLHAHIIYYRESRVNHRVIFKPDCLCLYLFLLPESVSSSRFLSRVGIQRWFYENGMTQNSFLRMFKRSQFSFLGN